MAAGLKLAVTVLLGLGGVERSAEHAAATGRVLAEMAPHQAAALTLMVVPGTPLWDEQEAGRFTLPDSRGMLRELRTLLEHAAMPRGLFLANHASNYLPLKLRMPRDREPALRLLDAAWPARSACARSGAGGCSRGRRRGDVPSPARWRPPSLPLGGTAAMRRAGLLPARRAQAATLSLRRGNPPVPGRPTVRRPPDQTKRARHQAGPFSAVSGCG